MLHEAIVALARAASVEMTWRDVAQLDAARSSLAAGTSVFASFLPGQTWRRTVETCAAIRDAGFEPVPHIPVRQLTDSAELERLATELVEQAASTPVRNASSVAENGPADSGMSPAISNTRCTLARATSSVASRLSSALFVS